MSTTKKDKKNDGNKGDLARSTAGFQCAICGAIFSTDEDRKQHLEKEAHAELREDTTPEDMQIANKQEKLDESHPHHV